MPDSAFIGLHGARTSVLFAPGGVPAIAYWGPRLPGDQPPAGALGQLDRPVPNGTLDHNPPLTVLPEAGTGFAGWPGLAGHRAGQDWLTRFETAAVERPAADTVRFRLEDAVAALTVWLDYRLDANDVLTVDTRLVNDGDHPYQVEWLAAACLPLAEGATEILRLRGRWSQEFLPVRERLDADGAWLQENRRGRTSHDRFPGLFIGPPGFGEQQGPVTAVHLGWSGNHRLLVERLADGNGQLQLGELFLPGEVSLAAGQTLIAPTVYATRCEGGLSRASANLHGALRDRLDWPDPTAPRPVVLNTWEAIYFDHDRTRLEALVDRAGAIGVERFVLDDGWFRGRDGETRALGDWYVDEIKYPQGLHPLVERVRERGMTFGLWVEPEMVNADSDLFRAHPDWILALPGREQPLGRYQYVLDLARADVRAYLLERLDVLLSTYAIGYLKWDMNRDLTHPGHAGAASVHNQTLALYGLIDELRARHPQVEIESCSSGGGRADYGILARTHRVWPSDCNDALERQRIQRGFSLFFPPEVMGTHIGPEQSHTTGRRLGIGLRGLTAFFGHFGLELDVTALDGTEAAEVAGWIALYKRHRALLHGGRSERLEHPDPAVVAHGVVAHDGGEALFALVQTAMPKYAIPPRLALAGLDPAADYRVRLLHAPEVAAVTAKHTPAALHGEGAVLGGAWLVREGVQLPLCNPAEGFLLHCERIAPNAHGDGNS